MSELSARRCKNNFSTLTLGERGAGKAALQLAEKGILPADDLRRLEDLILMRALIANAFQRAGPKKWLN